MKTEHCLVAYVGLCQTNISQMVYLISEMLLVVNWTRMTSKVSLFLCSDHLCLLTKIKFNGLRMEWS